MYMGPKHRTGMHCASLMYHFSNSMEAAKLCEAGVRQHFIQSESSIESAY